MALKISVLNFFLPYIPTHKRNCKRKHIVHGTKQMIIDMLFTPSCCLDRVQVTTNKSLNYAGDIIIIMNLTTLTSLSRNKYLSFEVSIYIFKIIQYVPIALFYYTSFHPIIFTRNVYVRSALYWHQFKEPWLMSMLPLRRRHRAINLYLR